jgi:hypothetical protein
MRLGTRTQNEFISVLNEKNEQIKKLFLSNIVDKTKPIEIQVMLGDATVTNQKTFDQKILFDYFKKISDNLADWNKQDVSISNNEDLRRVFFKFEVMEGNYLISGHISVQFHVLLYYKPIQKVIDVQKELSEIIDLTKNKENELSDNSDELVLEKLKEMGYKDLDHQKLFEIFYDNDEFREKIFSEIEKKSDTDFQKFSERKNELFKELDSLLIETYQTSSAIIDDAKLVNGEEGCLITLDMEFVKNNIKEGLFDPRKISDKTKENISRRINEIFNAITL